MSYKLKYEEVEILQMALRQQIQGCKMMREIPLQDFLAVNGFLRIGCDELPEGKTEEDIREQIELIREDYEKLSDKLKEMYGV